MYVSVICVQTISTIHLRGSTWKPLGGNRCSQSTFSRPLWPILWPTPSIPPWEQQPDVDARRHLRSTPTSSGPSLRPYPLRGSRHPSTGDGGEEIASVPDPVAS